MTESMCVLSAGFDDRRKTLITYYKCRVAKICQETNEPQVAPIGPKNVIIIIKMAGYAFQ